MQLEAPLTLILSPLRAGRGERERTRLGSLFGDLDTVSPKVPSPFGGQSGVRFDCMDVPSVAAYPARRRAQHLAGVVVRASPSVPRSDVPFRAARWRPLRQPRWLPLQTQASTLGVQERRLAPSGSGRHQMKLLP